MTTANKITVIWILMIPSFVMPAILLKQRIQRGTVRTIFNFETSFVSFAPTLNHAMIQTP